MDLATLRRTILGRYGRSPYAGEDELFPREQMHYLINAAHRTLAERALCYRQTQTYTLPAASGGVSTVSLDCNVIEIIPDRCRFLNGSTWVTLSAVDESDVVRTQGAIDSAGTGTPIAYWLQRGEALDAVVQALVYPGIASQVSNGFKCDVYVYPSLMSAETDTPAIQPAEHPAIVALCCAELARTDASRGRPDAPVQMWEAEARRALDTLSGRVRRQTRPARRTIRMPAGRRW